MSKLSVIALANDDTPPDGKCGKALFLELIIPPFTHDIQ